MGLMMSEGKFVGRDEIALVPTPEATASWKPVPHSEVIDAVTDVVARRDHGNPAVPLLHQQMDNLTHRCTVVGIDHGEIVTAALLDVAETDLPGAAEFADLLLQLRRKGETDRVTDVVFRQLLLHQLRFGEIADSDLAAALRQGAHRIAGRSSGRERGGA